jgi:hypothetical protein
MSIRYSFVVVLLMFTLLAATTSTAAAFMTSSSSSTATVLCTRQSSSSSSATTSTQLAEQRRWNFNEGQSPWGLKTNAEIWNGRVAQVRVICICNTWRQGNASLLLGCSLLNHLYVFKMFGLPLFLIRLFF